MSSMTEAIRLVISGDSKGGVKALKDLEAAATGSEKKLTGTMAGLNKASNVALGAFVVLGAFIGKSVKDYADFAITVAKANAQTDMGAEATSRFIGQLQMFHVDTSKAGMSLKTLENSMHGLAIGTPASVDAFKTLGLTWADLKSLKPEDQLTLIRDRLSEVQDPAARSAAATTLLGRGAKDMALWYTASAGAMAKVNDQLKQNGQIMTEGQLKDAEKAAFAWKGFTGALKGTEYTVARTLLPSLTKLLSVVTFLLQRLRPFAPVLVPLTVALGAFVAVVKTAVFVQRTWNQLLGVLPARLLKAKVAEEGLEGATVAETGAMKAGIVTAGLYVAAIAAIAVEIYLIVKAYQSWRSAADQAAAAAAGAQATLDANASKLTPAQVAADQAGINRDKYKSPGLGGWLGSAGQGIWDTYLRPLWGGLQGKKYGAGGDFIARGAQQIVVGDNPAGERVTVTPLGQKASRGDTRPLILVTGNTFVGTSRDAERHIMEIVNRQLGPRMGRLTRGMATSG